ncbi:serine/arginine repetitive matrix protein 5-like isoform X2 [Actinia tenebrosa]|nr:serine/arginine repetitive matrix protein 5-like isoform X2 [Actinia tenebrosa]XP_031569619.1 serine/arginine repetitive matrix protein 5-like isoform X2 [Actinia tenebrosa]
MGGNLKLYEDHIAISSPKRKIKKPSLSPYKAGLEYERSKLESSTDLNSDLQSESMDTPLKGGKDAIFSDGRRFNKHGDDIDFGTSRLSTSIENLDISDMSGRFSRKDVHDSDGCDDISIRRFHGNSNDRDYSPIRREQTRSLDRQGDFSTTESKHDMERDFSPVHSTDQVLLETKEYYKAKSSLTAKSKNHVLESASKSASGNIVSNAHEQTKPNEDINVLESLSRYDLTLSYVNQQNMTLQNGDYNGDLDIDLSDLSSDVFTDSEIPMTIPDANEWSRNRQAKDFYPDSPTSECAFFKTPCSSRKNSLDSSLSEESLSDKEPDIRGKIQVPVRKSIVTNGHNGYTNGVSKVKTKGALILNGKPKSSVTPSQKPVIKNDKSKVGSTENMKYKRGGKGKISTKKIDYARDVKSKVDSFRNKNHVPGGGNKKITNGRINNYKHVETRTDTHGVEAYSNLPAEFQEIARRLARQDKDLRDVTGGGSRPRSRLSSRSSRGESPRERSPTRSDNLAKYSRLSASSSSLVSGKSKMRRNPSLHPRPVTPSLSRSHPATSCTLYNSRSRPSSRQASRSSSPVRSRNSSPSRGRSSRPSSPTNKRTSRSNSPSNSRNPRRSSVSGGSSAGARSKTPTRSSSRSRLDDTRPSTPVMDIFAHSTSRSLFQVVPVNR